MAGNTPASLIERRQERARVSTPPLSKFKEMGGVGGGGTGGILTICIHGRSLLPRSPYCDSAALGLTKFQSN